MACHRESGRLATRALLWAGGVAVFVALSCGEPLGPLEPRWVKLATFPNDVGYLYGVTTIGVEAPPAGERIFTAGVSTSDKGIIYEFEGNELSLAYEYPYPGSCFEAIATGDFAIADLWAAGSKGPGVDSKPLLVQKRFSAEKWEEVFLPAPSYSSLSSVYQLDGASGLWVLLTNHKPEFYGRRTGTLGLFRYNNLQVFPALGDVSLAYEYEYPHHVTYALEYAGDSQDPREIGPGYSGRGKLYISKNLGVSWDLEFVPGSLGGRTVHAAENLYVSDGILYILVKFNDGAVGIVRREGDAGKGNYELLFLSYQGPFFHEIRAFTLRHYDDFTSPGRDTAAVGIGSLTSLIYDESGWRLERLPYLIDFMDVAPARYSGFVACGRNVNFGGWELLFHP